VGDDDPVFLADLIDSFLVEAPATLATIREAVRQVDASGLRSSAHALKGSSGTMGASRLSSICADLESQAKSGKLEGATALLKNLEDEFASFREDLESARAAPASL